MKARSVLASFLVACASFSHAQQLTQADIQAAFVAALKEYAMYTTGEDWYIPTLPLSFDWDSVAFFLTSSGTDQLSESFAHRWDPIMQNLNNIFLPAFLASTNRTELVQILNAVRALGSVSNDLSVISTQLSDMDQNNVDELDYLSGQLADLVLGMQSVNTDLGAINTSTYNASLAAGDILGILRNQENPIDVDIRTGGIAFDILERILHAIQEGSSSGAGFVDGVTNLANQGYNVPVDVKNFDSSGSNLDDVLSVFASDLSERDWNTLVQNFDGDGSDWLTAFESSVLMRSISNSLASLSPSQRFLSTAEVVTASTVETVVTNNLEYSADMVAASNTAAKFKFDFHGEHSDPENPWQPAPIYNTMQSAGRFFAKPDPATSSDVLLMGSNNPNNRRAGPRLVPLPEIRFDLEETLLATNEYYNMKNIFNLLWRVLGGAAQLMLLASFVHWYATRQKG